MKKGKKVCSEEKHKEERFDPKELGAPVIYRPSEDPSFFNIFVDAKHIEHLAKKDMDDESRLEVIYRVLKD